MPVYRGHKLKVWKNKSRSNYNKPPYETIQWSNGEFTCNCGGWLYPKNGNPRTCIHVRDAEAEVRRSRLSPPPKQNEWAEAIDEVEKRMSLKMSQKAPKPEIEVHLIPHPTPIHPEGRKFKRLIRVAI